MQRPKKQTLELGVLLAVIVGALVWKAADDGWWDALAMLGAIVLVLVALNVLLLIAGKLGR